MVDQDQPEPQIQLQKRRHLKISSIIHLPSSMRLWLKSPGWSWSTSRLASSHIRSITTWDNMMDERFIAVLRIRNVYPRSRFFQPRSGSRIQQQQQKRRGKKICRRPSFFVATNSTKLKSFYFWTGNEKQCEPIYKEFLVLFTQNIVTKLSKIRV